MADVGSTIIGTGVNMGVGRGLNAIGMRSPVPLPSFYNPNSPHPFRDSQANQLLHGNRRAWGRYGGRIAGTVIGNAVLPVFGGMIGGWLGGKIGDRVTTPGTAVTIGDINTDGSGGGRTYINPSTGEVRYGISDYGPYSSGYQFGSGGPSLSDGGFNYNHGGSVLPDFSQLGDFYAGEVDSEGNKIDKPTLKERREMGMDTPQFALSGVSNFMVGGFPVINGVNPGMGNYNRFGGSNQGYVKGRDPGG